MKSPHRADGDGASATGCVLTRRSCTKERPGATCTSATSTFESRAARIDCTGPAADPGSRDLEPRAPGNETDTREYDNCTRGSVALWTVHGGSHLIAARTAALQQAWQYIAGNAD
ncbi:MAG: hypothetical protein JW940_03875 [Polyangiaceae bacterium]|nr:hypothetical protein [Polyangiaceae bacterium]